VLGRGARAWECVNIARDLESCECLGRVPGVLHIPVHAEIDTHLSPLVGGGCVFPLSAYFPIGVDCTALPGVADVSCLSGRCVVHRCLRDYVPALDGTRCNHEYLEISLAQPDIDGAADNVEIESVPARIFGLEHVPL
jgi:hypothetical protein